MKKFIEVTFLSCPDSEPKKALVNLAQVWSVCAIDGKAVLTFSNGNEMRTLDSYDALRDRLCL